MEEKVTLQRLQFKAAYLRHASVYQRVFLSANDTEILKNDS